MRLVGKFTFVKFETGKAKETGNEFMVVHLLDENKDSCRFFVSDKNFMDYINSLKLNLYEPVVCVLDVSFYSENWRVSLKELSKDSK